MSDKSTVNVSAGGGGMTQEIPHARDVPMKPAPDDIRQSAIETIKREPWGPGEERVVEHDICLERPIANLLVDELIRKGWRARARPCICAEHDPATGGLGCRRYEVCIKMPENML